MAGAPTFRIAGIPVHIPLSAVLGVVLLAYLWAPSFAGATQASPWVVAVAFAVLLSLATLIHEFAHALTARALGYPVQGVVLQFLGGVTTFERHRSSAMSEAAVAAAGPIATFLVAGVSHLVGGMVEPGGVAAALAGAMTWANLIIGIYNSLPGLPLDGGNVLRCLIWAATGSERRGTVVAAWLGRALAIATILVPVLLLASGWIAADLTLFLVSGLLAAMLWSGATTSLRGMEVRERAADLSAAGLARRALPVDRDLPLAEAIRRAAMVGAGALVVVDPLGRPTGIGQNDAIEAVPPERRPWVAVGQFATPVDRQSVIPGDMHGVDFLTEVASRGRDALIVLDPNGLVYGVLLVADIDAALRASR